MWKQQENKGLLKKEYILFPKILFELINMLFSRYIFNCSLPTGQWQMSDLFMENSTSLLIYISHLIYVPLSLFQILATPVRINKSQMFSQNLGTWWAKLTYQWQKKKSCWPYDWPLVRPSNLAPRQQLVKEADVHAVLINILSRRTHLWVNAGNTSLFPSLNFYYNHINSWVLTCTARPAGSPEATRAQKDHS